MTSQTSLYHCGALLVGNGKHALPPQCIKPNQPAVLAAMRALVPNGDGLETEATTQVAGGKESEMFRIVLHRISIMIAVQRSILADYSVIAICSIPPVPRTS